MENVRGMQSRWSEIEADFNTYLNATEHDYQFTGKLLWPRILAFLNIENDLL